MSGVYCPFLATITPHNPGLQGDQVRKFYDITNFKTTRNDGGAGVSIRNKKREQ